jgi:hypothetical protein
MYEPGVSHPRGRCVVPAHRLQQRDRPLGTLLDHERRYLQLLSHRQSLNDADQQRCEG